MAKRRTLIQYHFNRLWDILPNRAPDAWVTIGRGSLGERLLAAKQSTPDIVVSGDCMAAIAAHRNGLPLVWYDAHGDFNTAETSETGSLGGMVLAMMAGVGDLSLCRLCDLDPVSDILHVGGSEFDVGEVDRMRGAGVHVAYRAANLDPSVVWRAQEHHLHIDTDVIRTSDLPSSIHPAPTGMRLKAFYEDISLLLPRTSVLSIKTPDPTKDVSGVGESIINTILEMYDVATQS